MKPISPIVDWQEDEETLYQLYRDEQDAELKIRWHALWLLRKGHSLPETVQVVGIHPRSLFRWLSWYREGGIAAIRQHQKGNRRGRSSFLTPEQCDQLRQQAADTGFRTLREAQRWVEQNFQVRYTLWGIRSLFQRLKIRKKTPRPMAVQADPKVQEEWKEKTLAAALKEAGVTRQTVMVWADEMRGGTVRSDPAGLGPTGGEDSPAGSDGAEMALSDTGCTAHRGPVILVLD